MSQSLIFILKTAGIFVLILLPVIVSTALIKVPDCV